MKIGLTISIAMIAVGTLLLGCAPIAPAQGYATVEFAEVFRAGSLAGVVTAWNTRDGLPGVLVEECTHDWKQTIGSTRTDETGHFKSKSDGNNSIHYLRMSKDTFNPLQVRVKIVKGKRDLWLALIVAA